MFSYSRRGFEFFVNSQVEGHQFFPDTIGLAGGGFVAVWDTMDATQDGSGRAIKMQLLDTNGALIGPEIVVNDVTSNDQGRPSITALANGNIIVTWETSDVTQDGSGYAIKAKIFDASGNALGGEFLVNNKFTSDQKNVSVTALENGGFVLTWETADTTQDGRYSAIKGRLYDASGNATSSEFLMSPIGVGAESNATVTSLANGGFVTTWTLGTGTNADVYAQIFDASGVKTGAPISVATNTTYNQNMASAVGLADGRIVVSWQSANSLTTKDYGISAQIFASDGTKIGSEFAVNTTLFDVDYGRLLGVSDPQIVELPNGGFLISWVLGYGDAPGSSIRAQAFDANGTAVGEEFVVTTVTDRGEVSPAMSVDGNGNLFVLWESAISNLSNYDIKGQIFSIHAGPAITSNGGGERVTIDVLENNSAVTTVASTNPNGGNLTYSIVSGLDASRFTIDASTGVLKFINSPNFETRIDSGSNNIYDVNVAVSDGIYTDIQSLSVAVKNVNEGQTFGYTSSSYNVRTEGSTDFITLRENVAGEIAKFSATDADRTPVIYSISGADAALFSIDANTGSLRFISSPNYEMPQDTGGNNFYNLTVTASDGEISTSKAVEIEILNLNEAPYISSSGGGDSAALNAPENSSGSIVQIQTIDPDTGQSGNYVTYSIVGGADASLFRISQSSGFLYFLNGQNFENPTDANGDNVYDVIVQASDGYTTPDSQALAITVTNVNEAAVFTSGTNFTATENNSQVGTVSATDPESDALTYAISGGADASRFTINGQTGAVSFINAPNFEQPADVNGDNVYNITVSASDGSLTTSQAVKVTVSNAQEAVYFTSPNIIAVSESSANPINVAAVDPDGATVSYEIVGGADAALFTIHAVSGALSFLAIPDYETPADADGDNHYDVVIRASAGSDSSTQTLTLTVDNVNETPVIISASGGSVGTVHVAEGGKSVSLVEALDPENATLSYTITGGVDAARFVIDSETGALSFVNVPNYEAPSDANGDNVYDVTVSATDGTTSDSQSLSVVVDDVNELPLFPGPFAGWADVAENTTFVYDFSASDPEGAVLTFSINRSLSDDNADFTIDANTGQLYFIAPPDFENTTALNGNAHHIVVEVSDGVNVVSQQIHVAVQDVNEPITMTSFGGADNVALTVLEQTTAVAVVSAVDEDGRRPDYMIAGGADASSFEINHYSGQLRFRAAPDREAPADANGDNIYDVIVSASDILLSVYQSFAITVGNVNEGVAITSSNAFGGTENQTAVGVVTANDVDGDAVTFAIAGGVDAAFFAIDAATGALSFINAPNFETPGDANGDNVYHVDIVASDGSLSSNQSITVTVGNQNEGNSFTSASAFTTAENSIAAGLVVASDIDGDAVTYSIAGGDDASRFTINATTGALSFVNAPNFEAPSDVGANNVYNLVVRASDGSLASTQAVAVTVGNVNEALAITSNGAGSSAALSVAENGSAVTQVQAVDQDGTAAAYSIVGGADAARFTINAVTGQLAFVSAPNREAPTDADGNNVYDVVVQASDGEFVDQQALSVTVTNVNEGLAITSNGGGATAQLAVTENSSAVTQVQAVDQDGTASTYSIVGGADAARFTINAQTGQLAFVSAPNHEVPTDADGNNVYDVIVQASDGQFTDQQALSVSIINVNEGVTITGNSKANTISTTTTVSGQLKATALEDTIYGLGGNDSLYGGDGADYIDGGTGNDNLYGQGGADLLLGGSGADRFIFENISDSRGANIDTIFDFNKAETDRISLSAIDANISLSGDQSFTFIGTNAFTGAARQLRYTQSDGDTWVSGDVNGDGVADFQIRLLGTHNLASTDFIL